MVTADCRRPLLFPWSKFGPSSQTPGRSARHHLLVPGGKWQTVIARPVRWANLRSSHFHRRTREPLLPPLSAVISNELALQYAARPIGAPTW